MKHEVFILGQTIDLKARRDSTEMRKGRRIEKGSREGIEKETKRLFEEKEGLRDPPFIRISRSEENQILEVKDED